MNAAGQRRLTPILAGVALALAFATGAFALGVGRGVHWDEPVAPEPLPPIRAAAMPASKPLGDFTEVWQRPLFMADRKPVATSDGDDSSSNIGDLELTGIIMTPGLHMALLRDTGKNTTVRVKEGASMQEGHWTLASLTPRSAMFENGGQRRELTLKVAAPDPLANQKPGTPGQPPQGGQPPRPPQASADDGVRVIQQPGGGMTGPNLPRPQADGARNAPPRQDDADLQRARIEALKAAVQKRRLEQQQQQRQQDVQ
ncbi:hypothetical protein KPL74_15580 [Bacillus sp. NP157]|nr:hypothetical protein KPL74_15580 [Bacillus sp. NP157]